MNQRLIRSLLGIQVFLLFGDLQVMSASLKSETTGQEETNTSVVKMEKELPEQTFFSNTDTNETFLDFLKEALEARSKATVTRLMKPSATQHGQPRDANTVPRVNGLGFEPENRAAPPRVVGVGSIPLETGNDQGAHKKGGKEGESDGYPTHLIVLLLGSFVGGITLTSSVGMLIYFYKRKRWKDRNITVEADMNSPKLYDAVSGTDNNEVTTDEDSSPSSESLAREDSVSDGIRNVLLGQEVPLAAESPLVPGTTGHFLPDVSECSTSSSDKCNSNLKTPQRPGVLALSELSTPLSIVSSDTCNRVNIDYIAEQIGAEGGAIQSSDSDVSVIVPPGSVPAGVRNLSLGLKVDLSGDALTAGHSLPALVQLSPAVQLLAQGIKCFSKPVIVKLPHRAHLTDGSVLSSIVAQNCPTNLPHVDSDSFNCKLKVLEIQSAKEDNQNNSQWREVFQYQDTSKPIQPAYFTFDKDFVFIHTYRPMTLVAVGCVPFCRQKENTQRLKMSVLTYGNYWFQSGSGRWQAELRVYICDGFRDACQRVRHQENSLGGCRQSPLKEILVDPLADLSITLSNAMDPGWTWQKSDGSKSTKVIPSGFFDLCSGTPTHVNFRCQSALPCEQQPPFLATVAVSQSQIEKESLPTEYCIPVTDNFLHVSL